MTSGTQPVLTSVEIGWTHEVDLHRVVALARLLFAGSVVMDSSGKYSDAALPCGGESEEFV